MLMMKNPHSAVRRMPVLKMELRTPMDTEMTRPVSVTTVAAGYDKSLLGMGRLGFCGVSVQNEAEMNGY